MGEVFKNMFKRAWGIIISGNTTWDEISAENKPVKIIRENYVYPWIIFTVTLSFVFNLFYTQYKAFEFSLLNAIITALSLLGGYFISNLICLSYLKKSKPELAVKNDCETLIVYSYTIIIVIDIVTIIIPSLFFLRILSIFIAYVIWEGCRAIWLLKDEERGNIVLIFSIVLIFIPIIINKVIHLMLPNA